MTISEQSARYDLMRAKDYAKQAVYELGDLPDAAAMAALAVVDACDKALLELNRRIAEGSHD